MTAMVMPVAGDELDRGGTLGDRHDVSRGTVRTVPGGRVGAGCEQDR